MDHAFLSFQYCNWTYSYSYSIPVNHPLKDYWFANKGNLFIVEPLKKKQYEIEVLFPAVVIAVNLIWFPEASTSILNHTKNILLTLGFTLF